MTTIAALIDGDTIYMASDSRTTRGWSQYMDANQKIIRRGEMLIGHSGAVRGAQIVEHTFQIPEHLEGVPTERYMVASFIPALREAFKDQAYSQVDDNRESQDSQFLIAYRGALYTIESDFTALKERRNFYAIGSGSAYALGALQTTIGEPARARIERAVQTAISFDSGTGGAVQVEVLGDEILGSEEDEEQDPMPDSIEDEADMDEDDMPMPDVDEDTGERGLIHQVKDTLTRWFSRDAPPQQTRLKVNGNQWVIVWSNNFEDREGEIFTQKAIDDYITRVDTGIVEPPDLWVHHAGPETKIGKAKWVGRHGHFVLAGGTFDETEKARKARDYYERRANKTSVSHGFTFPAWGFDGKHYNQFNTFEISLLPRGAEANRYTTLQGVRSMTLDDKKRRYLANVFGEDTVEEMLTDLDNAGKALEETQAAFKDFSHTEDDPTPDEGTKGTGEGDTPGGSEALLPELVKAQAEVMGMVKDMSQAIGAWRKEVEAQMATLQQENKTLRDELALTPSASRSDSTVIPDSEAADEKGKIKEKENSGGDSFWDFARGGNL